MSLKVQSTERFSFTINRASKIFLLANVALTAAGLAPLQATGQSFLQPEVTMSSPVSREDLLDPDAKEDGQYSDGTKAIHDARWADAEGIFGKLALQHGSHSDGAYYWQAYAENKQGNSAGALKTCANLRQAFAHSQWNEECNALAMEIGGARTSLDVDASARDETANLHAIDALMAKDQPRALAEIQSILNGNQSEGLKERALFLLVANDSPAGRKILAEAANSSANAPLQSRARQILATLREPRTADAQSLHRIGINVMVTDASGKPVSGLSADDFTVRDNKQPVTIESFHAIDGKTSTVGASGAEESSQVTIVIDAVNTSLTGTAYVRQQVEDYLHGNGGHMDHPVTISLFDGSGMHTIGGPSSDGNKLAADLAQASARLHLFRRSQGFFGEEDRIQFSLNALNAIAAQAVKQPGRKLLLWVSPGWPLLQWSDLEATQRREESVFGQIVALTNNLRLAQITLYSVYPEDTGGGEAVWNLYKDYRKPVLLAERANLANLALPVFAEHSGGKVLTFTKDPLSVELAACVADASKPYYAVHFLMPVAKRKNEFHAIAVTVNRPGLTVSTNHGYYNQP